MTPLARIAATVAVLLLPFTLVWWYRSHIAQQHRFDLTHYKSVWMYMHDGLVAFDVLALPTETPSRSEFRAPLRTAVSPIKSSFGWRTSQWGPYRRWWFVFPLWVPNAALFGLVVIGVLTGPFRTWYRRQTGRCTECGYDLRGSRRRCPECGQAIASMG